MAEEEEQAEESDVPPEPKGSRLNQFIILAVVVLICQSALAYVLVTRYVIPQRRAALGLEDGEETETVAEARREIVPVTVPPVYRLDEILVNPMDETALRYLNCLVTLELENEDVRMELEDKLVAARVRDLIFKTLGKISVEDMDSTEDRQAIKQILKDRLNESGLLESGEVTGILFERFILH